MTRVNSVWAILVLTIIPGCGDSGAASVSPPEPPPVWVSLDAGTAATCGVAADGRGYCCGHKWAAGRGGPRTALIAAPRELPLRNWVTIEAGHSIACGLTRDHETYCWGFPTSGVDTVPGRIPGDAGFAGISVGDAHACGLTSEGMAYCWGDDFRGQTGTGQKQWVVRVATPVEGDLRFRTLRAGPESTCAIDLNGDLFCWGGSEVVGEAGVPRLVQQGLGLISLEYGGRIRAAARRRRAPGRGAAPSFRCPPHDTGARPPA